MKDLRESLIDYEIKMRCCTDEQAERMVDSYLAVKNFANTEECRKEDDLTIKFAEWCLVEFLTSLNTGVDAKADNIEELLQIFKDNHYLKN